MSNGTDRTNEKQKGSRANARGPFRYHQLLALPARLLGSPLAFAKALEILLDGLGVLGGHATSQFLNKSPPFFLGQRAPALHRFLELLVVHVTRTAIVRDVAVGHGTARAGAAARRFALAAVGAAAAVALAAALLLVFKLLDDFIEAANNVLLDLLGDRTPASQLQPAATVVHFPGDPVEVLFLPGEHVQQHQSAHSLVALGSVGHIVEQPANGALRFLLLEHCKLGHSLVEEV